MATKQQEFNPEAVAFVVNVRESEALAELSREYARAGDDRLCRVLMSVCVRNLALIEAQQEAQQKRNK